jgi:hypothetical protein
MSNRSVESEEMQYHGAISLDPVEHMLASAFQLNELWRRECASELVFFQKRPLYDLHQRAWRVIAACPDDKTLVRVGRRWGVMV